MINKSKYNKIFEIYNEFSFLKNTIQQAGIASVFSFKDLLDENLFYLYSRSSDIYKLYTTNDISGYYYSSNNAEKIEDNFIKLKNLFPEKFFLYKLYKNLINSTEFTKIIENKDINTIKDFYLKLMDLFLKFNFEIDVESKYYDSYNFTYDECMTYLIYIVKDLIESFMYRILTISYSNEPKIMFKTFLQMFNEEELDKINNVFERIYSFSHTYNTYRILNSPNIVGYSYLTNLHGELKSTSSYNFIQKKLEKEMIDIYNNESIEDINKYCDSYCNKIEFLYKFFDVEYMRKVSILNDKLSDNEKEKILSSFKSAASIKDLIHEMYKNKVISKSRIEFILNDCILQNNKIKDRKFPIEKTKVMIDAIRNLFLVGSCSSVYDVLTENEISEIIHKFKNYFYDPYFIESIYNTASMFEHRNISLVNNSSSLLEYLFNKKSQTNDIKYFIKKYLKEIQKDNNSKINPCNDKVSLSNFTYGSLEFIINKYIGFYETTTEKYKDLILNNIILDESETEINKFEVMLFYITNIYSYKLAIEDLGPYGKDEPVKTYENKYFDDSAISQVSNFRKAVEIAHYSTIGLYVSTYYMNYENSLMQRLRGSISPFLASLNYSNKYNDEYFLKYFMYVYGNRGYRNYSYNTYDISEDNIEVAKNAYKFALLRYVNEMQKDFKNNGLESYYIKFNDELKNIINKNNKIILTASSDLGCYMNHESGTSRYKFIQDNSIDMDTLLIYLDFINLNKENHYFEIDDSFDNIYLLPVTVSHSYSFKRKSSKYGFSRNLISKFDEESIVRKIRDIFINMTDETKKYIYTKFFKPFIEDSFKYNEFFNNSIISLSDYLYDNYTSRYDANLKYLTYNSIYDTSEVLVNDSIMETFAVSYNDFFKEMKFASFDDKEKINELNNLIDQTVMNYNCLRTLKN